MCNTYISGLTRGCNFPHLIGAVFNWPSDITDYLYFADVVICISQIVWYVFLGMVNIVLHVYISGLTRGCNFPQLIGAVFNWPPDIYSFNLLLSWGLNTWIGYLISADIIPDYYMWLERNFRPLGDIFWRTCFQQGLLLAIYIYQTPRCLLWKFASKVLVIFDICLMAVSFIFWCLSVNPSITLASTSNIFNDVSSLISGVHICARCNIATAQNCTDIAI